MRDSTLPRFFELLHAAQDAVDEEDNFDVRTEDPASLAEWNRLRLEQQERLLELLVFIRNNGDDLRADIFQSGKPFVVGEDA